MSDELPEGWARAALENAGVWRSGGTPSRKTLSYFGGSIPWVKSGDLNDGVVTTTDETLTESGVANSSAKMLPAGTLSIALYGATIGRLGILSIDAATNQACANCCVNERVVDRWYLFYYLLSQRNELVAAGQGGAQPNISGEILKAWALLVPPLAEQRRIVEKVEALLARVNAARDGLAKVPALLKRFRQAVLAAACSGRLTEEWRELNDANDEWPTHPLSELFTMRNGKSLIAAKRCDGNVPVYGGNGLMGTHSKSNADGQVIVIGRVGAQCGNVHFVSGKVWVTDNAISIEAKTEVAPAFYAYFLRLKNLNQMSSGTGQPYVSQEILCSIEAPAVPLSEQQEIVRRVEALFALADTIERHVAAATARADKVTQAILAKAFRGELVPTEAELARQAGRDYEPASALLARVQRERDAALNSAGSQPRRARARTSRKSKEAFSNE